MSVNQAIERKMYFKEVRKEVRKVKRKEGKEALHLASQEQGPGPL
jgi:preprotein translocase subunit SecE